MLLMLILYFVSFCQNVALTALLTFERCKDNDFPVNTY